MRASKYGVLFLALVLAALAAAQGPRARRPRPVAVKAAQSKPIDFQKDVAPVLARCQMCHGEQMQMNSLRLDSAEAALRGGDSGPAIVPGHAADSKLIERVTSTKKGFAMPPTGPRLTAAEIATLKKWIDQGAKGGAAIASVASATTGHWSFRPIQRPAVPRGAARNPIDAFVLARLEKEGFKPAPEADRRTLLRRVTLDLTGLPPTPREIADFLADTRPGAYERVVDRLLISPHYGEKWARHWLDLAHYADSDGYEKDKSRPWSWRYRHWVIEALNRDLPFDQFTIQQLAGDLLPDADTDTRVATGFLRNTLTNREAGVSRAETRFEHLVDRTNTVGTTWLGLTVGCAQCHNHKYDPITHKDYYQLLAFFDSSDEEEMDAPLPGELGPYLQAKAEYDRKRADIMREYGIPELQAAWDEGMRGAILDPGKKLDWDFSVTSMRAMLDAGEKIILTPAEKRSERHARRLTDYFLFENNGPNIRKDPAAEKRVKEARDKLRALDAAFPMISQAPVMVEMREPVRSHLRLKGDYKQPGPEVQPLPPSFLPPLNGSAPKNGRASRLALAQWLVSRDNPLTARVTVNRIWQELFGHGLVRTSEDFGAMGEKPSHPELLDWLAVEFMERGWSMKQMVRTVVTSATYKQSSVVRPDLQQRDPENMLLARQSRRRLPAELIRDSALAMSGLLNTAIGGRSVRPPQPPGVAELAYANSVKWPESKGPDRYRRGLYVHFQRTVPYPQLINFDAPNSVVACSRRRVSNTPLQALNLLNDPVFFEAAQALGARVVQEAGPEPDARLDYAFELVLGRKPTGRERERVARFLDQQASLLQDSKSVQAFFPARLESVAPADMAAWVGVARVLMNLDEFMTVE